MSLILPLRAGSERPEAGRRGQEEPVSTPAWSITTALVAEGVGKGGGKEDVHGCDICGRCVQVTFYCISESNCGIRGCDSVFFFGNIFNS